MTAYLIIVDVDGVEWDLATQYTSMTMAYMWGVFAIANGPWRVAPR